MNKRIKAARIVITTIGLWIALFWFAMVFAYTVQGWMDGAEDAAGILNRDNIETFACIALCVLAYFMPALAGFVMVLLACYKSPLIGTGRDWDTWLQMDAVFLVIGLVLMVLVFIEKRSRMAVDEIK